MLMVQAVGLIQALFSHAALLPAAGGVLAGATFALFRSPFRSGEVRESESLMTLSRLGTLHCICGANQVRSGGEERRGSCRACGCDIKPMDQTLLELTMSGAEIKMRTRDLRDAAIRAAHLQLPASITSVEELRKYLLSDAKRTIMPAVINREASAGQAQGT